MQIESQQHRIPPTTNVQPEARIQIETTLTTKRFVIGLFTFVFCFHLFLITALTVYLIVQGIIHYKAHHQRHFHPTKWYHPLLSSTVCAAILSVAWQGITGCYPSKAFKAVFWLGPILTGAVALLHLLIGTSVNFTIGVATLIFSLTMSLYGCWVNSRLVYAIRVLILSSSPPPTKPTFLILLSILLGTLYSGFMVIGIGSALASRTKLNSVYISIILLSLAWTMLVIRNTMLASMSRVKYMFVAYMVDLKTSLALCDTLKHLMGSICIGSFLVPILGTMWGSARCIDLLQEGPNELCCSCAKCYTCCASTLVMYGNRWGFVHVGLHNKSFVQASKYAWDIFKKNGLESVIDSDLTSSFCFISAVTVGAISSLVSGIWALVVHKSYATELSLYAFIIGYLISRIAMAWQQACIAAYYVAYAENPENMEFDSTIPDRIQRLQRLQACI
ncbi:hypothetical protein CsatA_025783 [Cannabis sativa]